MSTKPSPDSLRRLRLLAAGPLSSDLDVPAQSQIGKYRIIREMARGAMGVVYEAEDVELKRAAAVKILKEMVSTHDVGRHRFQREAVTAARLSHPNVVQVFDAGEDQGKLYLAMELVRGRPLGDILAERKYDLRTMIRLLEQAARGVAAAHAIGVVHRDVKPANILVTEAGVPKVGDFGLAHWMDSDTALTKTGTPLGTPLYMAPEQVRGDSAGITPAADVYALGSILYEVLTGQPPHKGDNTAEIYGKILHEDAPLPRHVNTHVPRELETVTLKAIDKEPSRRYPTAKEFADDLGRWLDNEPVLARPVTKLGRTWRKAVKHRKILLPAAAAVAIAAGGWAWRESGQREALGRAQAREKAGKLLEEGRPALDRAVLYQYRPDADYDELVRQVDEGQRLIEAALRESPDFALAHHLMGQAWEIKGWDDKAEASWREAIRLDPELAGARFRLGRRLLVKAFLERIGDRADEGEAREAKLAALIAEATREIEAASAGRLEGEMLKRSAQAMRAYLKNEREESCRLAEEAVAAFRGAPGVEEFYWLIGISTQVTDARRMGSFNQAIKERPNYPLALFCRGSDFLRSPGTQDAAIEDFSRALRIHPRFLQAWLNRGVTWARKKDHARAIADFSEVIALDPNLPMGWHLRGHYKAVLGDLEGAMKDVNEVRRLNPRYAGAFDVEARIHQASERSEEALAALTRGLELNPSSLLLLEHRAEKNAWLKRWAVALEDYRTLLKVAPPDYPDRAMIHHAKIAHCRQMLGDWAGAIEECSTAIEVDPRHGPAWFKRAGLRRLAGDLKGALPDYDRAVDLEPSSFACWNERGEAKALLGRWAEAASDYAKALELEAPNASERATTFLNLAICKGHLGDLRGAIEDCGKAIGLQPRYARVHWYRGGYHYEAGDLKSALVDFDRALELKPADLDFLDSRAKTQLDLQHWPEAAADFAAMLKSYPPEHPNRKSTHLNLGLARFKQEDVAGGIEECGAALRIDPRYVEAYIKLCHWSHVAGRLEEALAAGDRAVELDPSSADRVHERGHVLVAMQRWTAAAADLRKALQMAPADWSQRAHVEQELKDVMEKIREE